MMVSKSSMYGLEWRYALCVCFHKDGLPRGSVYNVEQCCNCFKELNAEFGYMKYYDILGDGEHPPGAIEKTLGCVRLQWS